MRLKFLVIVYLLCGVFFLNAQVSQYTFTQSNATYTEITGGNVLGSTANDNESFNAIPLGFGFMYNDQMYESLSVNANGFVAMGTSVATSNTAISTGTTNNVIAVLNRDIKARADGELMTLTTGEAPNRIFTVQWKNYRRTPTQCANDIYNFLNATV